MERKDIIFSAVCGLLVSWLAVDFFGKYGLIFVIIFPPLSVLGLWLTNKVGKKMPFIGEAGKFFLVGAFADVIDIKIFQLLFWFSPFSILFKAVSFLAATFIKYWWNKHWAFKNSEATTKEKIFLDKQVIPFFAVTLIGLGFNVVSFYYFGKIETGMPAHTWTELSIILSALVSAVWNFLGYKFIVFKR